MEKNIYKKRHGFNDSRLKVNAHNVYVHNYLYCGYAQEEGRQMCAEVQNEAFLVKIANSNVLPTLRGFRWYPYFVNEAFLAKITII